MTDLVSAFESAQGEVQAAPTQRVPVKTTHINPESWRDLVGAITEKYNGFEPNLKAVKAAGMNASGQPTVLAALKRDKRHPEGSAHVTIYATGSVSWTNIDPVEL